MHNSNQRFNLIKKYITIEINNW